MRKKYWVTLQRPDGSEFYRSFADLSLAETYIRANREAAPENVATLSERKPARAKPENTYSES